MRLPGFPRSPAIPLGTTGGWLWRHPLRLAPHELRVHAHVIGKTGSGKSRFLAGLFLALQQAGLAASLIDPHGDLSQLVLAHLMARGAYADATAFQRIVYLDLPAALAQGRFLPFNVLNQPYDDHAMAEHIAEACMRAWPELAQGAPTFENILKHAVIVLRQNQLPLPALADLLTDTSLRNRLLANVNDPQVVRFFHRRMDQWGREAPRMKESTLNRADLLTLAPVLRFSLSQPENVLNFREILDRGQSLIINLALPHEHTRRLLGCLLMVGLEAAAKSRANIPAQARTTSHHLLVDEFSQFTAQSAESLARILSEARKFRLFCVLAHQNWTQASDRLKGALENVGLEVILKSGRFDAEYSARLLGRVNPMAVKHTVADARAEERTHPVYAPLPEQWETWVQAIQTLKPGEAWLRLPSDAVTKIRTLPVADVAVDPATLQAVQERYLATYFRPQHAIEEAVARHHARNTATVRRWDVVEEKM